MEDPLTISRTCFASRVTVETRNTAAERAYGDDGPLALAAQHLEWQLLQLSDVPPGREFVGTSTKLMNGYANDEHACAPPEGAERVGRVDGFDAAAQLAAFREVGEATLAAIRASKGAAPAMLTLGHLRVRAEITDEGFFIRLAVKFSWEAPARG